MMNYKSTYETNISMIFMRIDDLIRRLIGEPALATPLRDAAYLQHGIEMTLIERLTRAKPSAMMAIGGFAPTSFSADCGRRKS